MSYSKLTFHTKTAWFFAVMIEIIIVGHHTLKKIIKNNKLQRKKQDVNKGILNVMKIDLIS